MSDLELLALHGLAVKKAGGAPAVAAVLGAQEDDVVAGLDAAVAAGHAIGAKGTFMVTPAGRSWLDERYPQAFAEFRDDPAATAAYERFERINRELLTLFTDWQMVPAASGRVTNDHADAEYDRGIVDRLGDLHERAEKNLGRFSALDPRLDVYRRRLDEAYDQVLAGEHEYVSGARVDSYHTVWFELHEDLLRMLGREREEAP
ncbi:MAG TPA: hypothetical protein VK501_08580 [Baekduia sp.]|uniref:hypothetical protein n=1 Tax=Baekduia sp. TaxID=2600305 RepID=UPI002B657421|nr:hypothetical protein [Baekduia sp.]HMJ33960.1 hypothetical protein [Baekduia sp.]